MAVLDASRSDFVTEKEKRGSLEELRVKAAAELRERLQEMGARVEVDEEYRDRYELDFVLTRVQSVHAHVNLGVRVVLDGTRSERRDEAFFEGVRRGVVHRSILLEIDPQTVQTGGLNVARIACLSYLFDRSYGEYKSIGLRVFEDCSYDFFDAEESHERIPQVSSVVEGRELTGSLIAYFPEKGFGFLESSAGTKFFFHIANVADDELRVQLPSYIPGDVFPVVFKDGGRDGKKYPKATGVMLDPDDYEEEDDDDAY